MRALLGGKGANLAEMTRMLGADRIPPGFTISTEACVAYLRSGSRLPDGLADQVDEAIESLERQAGRHLGDPEDPLLVSVRSGAGVSMPGMLETILNLGMNHATVSGLAKRTGDERFAYDSFRRFVQMFGDVVRGIPGERFEDAIAVAKKDAEQASTRSSTRAGCERSSNGSRRSTGRKGARASLTIHASSSGRRSAPSSNPGTAGGQSSTDA